MCENCPNSDTCPKSGKRRLKLWELPPRFHCSVIGTCFALDELRKIAKKFHVRPEGEFSDYNLHGMFVGIAGGQGSKKVMARHLSKQLDTKFFSNLGRVRSLMEERDLREYWAHAVEKGDIAGSFWALLTHPACTASLREHLFGDVHMLSHLSGASTRVDMARTAELEKRIEELEYQNKIVRRKSRERIAEKEAFIRIQTNQLNNLSHRECLYEEALERIKHLEDTNCVRSQQIITNELQRHVQTSNEQTARLEKQVEEKDRQIERLLKQRASSLERVNRAQSESKALETALANTLSGPVCNNGSCPVSDKGGDLDLCGRCIVFVGGRTNQAPKFKELVERYNGHFLHHDGGLENSQEKLESVLSRADAVLFPVDCISHNATRDIKRFCKQGQKPFVPLPTSGLSTFTMGLQEAAQKISDSDS